MRHLNLGRTLGRRSSHQLALKKNLLSALVRHGKIETTLAKAKEVRPHAERFVTIGKKNTLAARRHAFAWIRDHRLVAKLVDDYAKRFADRSGGYTRISRLGPRKGDGAELALLEYLPGETITAEKQEVVKKAKDKEKPKKTAAKKPVTDKSKAKKVTKPKTSAKVAKKASKGDKRVKRSTKS